MVGSNYYPHSGEIIAGFNGNYKLLQVLGRGGNGIVFSACKEQPRENGKPIESLAIKILHVNEKRAHSLSQRRSRFEREIKTVLSIQEKVNGVLPILDSFLSSPNSEAPIWYVMPQACKIDYHNLSFEEKLKYIRALGLCLAELHSYGYAHRDIKPSNLLLYNGAIHLSDFGLVWNENENSAQITRINDNIGPRDFRPPELCFLHELNHVDYRSSDVFMFAKTIWMMLTNRHPIFHDYSRDNTDICIKKTDLDVQTVEPLNELLEGAIKYNYKDRINMRKCLSYIDAQLECISESSLSDVPYKWKYKELFQDILTLSPDINTFSSPDSINTILSKMNGIALLVFEESGMVYPPISLVNTRLISEKSYEFEMTGAVEWNHNAILLVSIDNIEVIPSDGSCIINIDTAYTSSNEKYKSIPLNDLFNSHDCPLHVSDSYTIKLFMDNE